MDDEKLCMITIGVVMLLFAGLVGYTVYQREVLDRKHEKKVDTTPDFAAEGDQVSVDYVGSFTNGVVFDTSLPSVAKNDTVPKSASFAVRPTYDDLSFKIGSGQMIKGFESSLIGKEVGQTYTVTIPFEQGYGKSSPELVYYINATMTIPMVQKYSVSNFKKIFPTVDIGNDTRFVHPMWKWPMTILSKDATFVTVRNEPLFGDKIKAFPWNTTVVDVSTQRNVIKLSNAVDEIAKETRVPFQTMSSFDPIWSEKANSITQNKEQLGYATQAGGQIIVDFNKEVAGKTLIFTITVNSITRS
jgi:FKBP-type peptidyl-prolyl cis-trans isomerase 2